MATQSVPERRMTAEEYVAFELASDERHEFHDGRVYAAMGGSRARNRIAGNVAMRLRDAARGTRCAVFMSAVRTVPDANAHYYPDVVVTCDPADDDPNAVTTPCVVVEVWPPESERLPLWRKLPRYHKVRSLAALVIIQEDARLVEVRWRNTPDASFVSEFSLGRGDVELPVSSLPGGSVCLTLDEIYEGAEPPPNAGLDASDPEPAAR